MANPLRTRLLLLAFAGSVVLAGGVYATRSRSAAQSTLALSQWHQQAAGMEKATRLHLAGGGPLLVYFYTDW